MCTVHSLEMTLSCLGFDIIKHFTQFPVVIIRRSQSQREASTSFRLRLFTHGAVPIDIPKGWLMIVEYS